jgi:hypothetical protein
MAKKIVSALPTFTMTDYDASLKTLTAAGIAVDRADNKAGQLAQAWAIASAVAIKTKAMTLDQIRNKLIAATPLSYRTANVKAGLAGETNVLNACGPRIKNWGQSFARIAEHPELIDKLIAGGSLNALRNEAPRKQTTNNGKGGKDAPKADTPKADAPAPAPVVIAAASSASFADLTKALLGRLKDMSVEDATNKHQGDLSRLMSAIAKKAGQVEAATRAAHAASEAEKLKKAA